MIGRVCLLIAALIPVGSASAAPLQPIEKWDLDYGETQCTAARSFGTSSDPIIFGIVPSISGETYQLLVSEARQGPTLAQESQGSVDFGEGPIKGWRFYYGSKDVKLRVHQYTVSAAQMEQARSATLVRLHGEPGDTYAFALSAMPAILDGLKKCTADLQQYWNMGGEKDRRISSVSVGDVRSLFNFNDYPAEALKNHQQGTVQYILLLDEKGAVASCDLRSPSGVPALDAMGCQVIKERAKFKPALDSQGKPVRSVFTTPPITWRLGS